MVSTSGSRCSARVNSHGSESGIIQLHYFHLPVEVVEKDKARTKRTSMNINRHATFRAALVIALVLIITIASSRLRADSGSCGGATTTVPFTDVMGNPFFCEIAGAFLRLMLFNPS